MNEPRNGALMPGEDIQGNAFFMSLVRALPQGLCTLQKSLIHHHCRTTVNILKILLSFILHLPWLLMRFSQSSTNIWKVHLTWRVFDERQ